MKVRMNPKLPPAKKITRETLRKNPLLAALARLRAKQLREAKREDAAKGQQELFPPEKPSS